MRKQPVITPDTMVLVAAIVYVYMLIVFSGAADKLFKLLNFTNNPTLAALVGGIVGAVCTGVVLEALSVRREARDKLEDRRRILTTLRADLTSIQIAYLSSAGIYFDETLGFDKEKLLPVGITQSAISYFTIYDNLSTELGVIEEELIEAIIAAYTCSKSTFDMLIHYGNRVDHIKFMLEKERPPDNIEREREAVLFYQNTTLKSQHLKQITIIQKTIKDLKIALK